MEKVIYIVIPCYNDWGSLSILVSKLAESYDKSALKIDITIVNDCSTEKLPEEFNTYNMSFRIINLIRNVGHQKAIAVGLSYLNTLNLDANDKVAVMDSDGEDNPLHIKDLFSFSELNPEHIIFAKRKKRNDSIFFKLSYRIYMFLFKILTGSKIDFGNYSLFPISLLRKIVISEDIWNHYSGSIIKSKLPYKNLSLNRGKRYKGESKMNLTSLVIHGLSSISVHLESVAIRLLFATVIFIFLSLIYVTTVFFQKFILHTAIPGWTSTVSVGIISISLQSFLIILVLAFLVLSKRNQPLFIPSKHFNDLIMDIEVLWPISEINEQKSQLTN